MPQTTRGARQTLDQLLADLSAIDSAADLDLAATVFNPRDAHRRLVDIRDLTSQIRRRLRNDLEPLLQRAETNRAAASLPAQLAQLEARVAQLEQAARRPEVIPLRPIRRSGDES